LSPAVNNVNIATSLPSVVHHAVILVQQSCILYLCSVFLSWTSVT